MRFGPELLEMTESSDTPAVQNNESDEESRRELHDSPSEFERSADDEYHSEDDGQQEEEEAEDSDEDMDEEPKLRYRRVGAGLREILDKDTASTLRVSDKFVVSCDNFTFVSKDEI